MKHAVITLREEKRRLLEQWSAMQETVAEMGDASDEAVKMARDLAREITEVSTALLYLCRAGIIPTLPGDADLVEAP